jgi:hypothetical protein
VLSPFENKFILRLQVKNTYHNVSSNSSPMMSIILKL